MTNEEMKAVMKKALEGSIDESLRGREGGKWLTLTEIEERVLTTRQTMEQHAR